MSDPTQTTPTDSDLERYSRQIRFPGIGIEGQRKLSRANALVVGCGALGSVIAETLVRAGIGKLRIVDRDFLELSNLQRQTLFTEADVDSGLPKAIVAAEKLKAINSQVDVEPVVADVTYQNIESLLDSSEIILDGTDNFETRFLINDVSIKHEIPWIFGGCLGCDGQSLTIVPGVTPCLNCVMLDGPPSPGSSPTCDSFGILASVINVIASIQALEAIKILSGNLSQVNRRMTVVSLWDAHLKLLDVSRLENQEQCPACGQRQFVWLNGDRSSHWAILCGRNAVQLTYPERQQLDLDELERRLSAFGPVSRNPFLLRVVVDNLTVTAFADGRAIVNGTEDISLAKRIYSQYLGN